MLLFSRSVVSDSLQPHGQQHTRLPCPSPSPGARSDSFFPRIGVFSNELALHISWPKYWSFSFSICPSNEYSGLISFNMDLLDLLVVEGTLKSLLQHHSSKASILQHSVKEESKKVGLKLNQKTKIMASGPITSWQIDGETIETVRHFIFKSFKITADDNFSHEIKRCLLV